MGWLIPRQDLSADQIRATELNTATHRIVVGAPGSGKTQLLIHRAARLREIRGTSADKFHLFVFTNVLKDYIRVALSEMGLPEDSVSTFDDWCKRTYQQLISARVPWDHEARRPDFGAIRHGLLPVLIKRSPEFEFVLVDEGQDLDPECFEILRAISSHVTVCFDPKQQLYDHGSSYQEAVKGLGIQPAQVMLLEAFRCCPYIVDVAAEYIEDATEKQNFVNQARTAQTERLTPLLYKAKDFDDERDNMIAVVKQRLLEDSSIGVLFPLKRQVEGFANAFREAEIAVETQAKGLDFGNNLPKLITIHSAKGLTFDTVLLPRLVPNSFPRMTESRIARMLYVGTTRATKWVYMSYFGAGLPHLDRLGELANRKPSPITITSEAMPKARASAASGSMDDDPFGLL